LKKRLFSANPREDPECHHNIAVQDFKGSMINFNKTKGISPLLPPISAGIKSKNEYYVGPVKSNPVVNKSNIQGTANFKKLKTVNKSSAQKKSKSKSRRFSDVRDKSTSETSNL